MGFVSHRHIHHDALPTLLIFLVEHYYFLLVTALQLSFKFISPES